MKQTKLHREINLLESKIEHLNECRELAKSHMYNQPVIQQRHWATMAEAVKAESNELQKQVDYLHLLTEEFSPSYKIPIRISKKSELGVLEDIKVTYNKKPIGCI